MKLATEFLATLAANSDVLPGNIYPAKGGSKRPGTEYWVVIATSQTGAHVIGFSKDGEPVSTASYLKGAMRERPIIGRCNIEKLLIEVLQ